MLRILHTADWHLGHTLHDFDRAEEHAAFLDWLLDTLETRGVDALLIAGDIFETANPPVRATRAWYDFLARARARLPDLDIVAIGGNHDSAARLDAPNPLLEAQRIHVVGGLPLGRGRQLDLDRLLIPLTDRDGEPAALLAAVPYLRLGDLPRVQAEDPLIEGVRLLYQRVLDAAKRRQQPGQSLIAMGHLYMAASERSPDSERRVLGGDQHPLPETLFPQDWAYVALGHLHLAQQIGRETLRYSGSPIPLSMTERGYLHQVVLVDVEDGQATSVRPLSVPRSVDLQRIPDQDFAPLDDILPALAALPDKGLVPSALPFLEVRVRLDRPHPGLRQRIEGALHGKSVRLLRVSVQYTGDRSHLEHELSLHQLDPEQVFLQRWHKDFRDPPSSEVLAAFHELLEDARQAEAE